jgi:hypothetical protein
VSWRAIVSPSPSRPRGHHESMASARDHAAGFEPIPDVDALGNAWRRDSLFCCGSERG